MSKSYRAILVDGRLRWLDEVPAAVQKGASEMRVRVTIEEKNGENQDELASLLDELAADNPFENIDNPVRWQRELRREGRP